MFTSPRLTAIHTVTRFMFGHHPTHGEMVAVYRMLKRRPA